MHHEKFMRKAIELAITSGKKGNNTFGAVLVHEGKIIAEAENTEETGDGYGHAETLGRRISPTRRIIGERTQGTREIFQAELNVDDVPGPEGGVWVSGRLCWR